MFIADPRFMPFTAWADSVILEDGSLPQAQGEVSWRAWATEVALIEGTAPDPVSFADWRSWATAWIAIQ